MGDFNRQAGLWASLCWWTKQNQAHVHLVKTCCLATQPGVWLRLSPVWTLPGAFSRWMQFITKKVLSSLCQYVNKMLQEFCRTYHHVARWVHYTESAVCSCYENLAVGCSPLEGNSFQCCIILYYIFVRTYTNLWGTKIKPLDIYIYFYTRSPDLNLTVTPRL